MGSKNKKFKNKNKNKNEPSNDSDPAPPAQVSNHHEGGGRSSKLITDSRFSSVHSDPRFQKVPKHKSKVAIDSRFDHMFTDKSFASSSAPLDKRGKRKTKKSEDLLRHYYRTEEEADKEEWKGKVIENDEDKEIENDEDEDDDDDEKIEEESGSEEFEKTGRMSLVTESSGESESDGSEDDVDRDELESTTDEDEYELNREGEEPELQGEIIPVIEQETRRLAVVNMDWRHVKAVDLYVVLNSFLPKNGQILSVAVYPSEFGLQRMKEEEVHGPVGLFDGENGSDDENSNDEIDNEKLRAYEKSKLRYYFAVVECDSSATADYLYKACDGVEFERSSNVLDLRFIPDSMEFNHPPRDVATEAPANYEHLNFQTQALQLSKINLSWDEDEPHRVTTLKRKFNADQLAKLELKEFLASDESETDDDENDNATEDQCDKKHKKRDLYRSLIQSGDGSDEDGEEDGEEDGQDMEVTFNTGLEDISKRILEQKDRKSETVWEAYLRKKREKKKARKNKAKYSSDDESSDTDQEAAEQPDDFFVEEPSVKRSKKEAQRKGDKEGKQHEDVEREAGASRAELELLFADDKGVDTGLKGYNLKRKKAKGKKGIEVPDEEKIPTVDYDDPRFSALFTSPLFALDPTDPQYKRSAAYARQIAQRQRKGDQRELTEREHMKLPANAQLPSDDPKTNNDEYLKSDVLPSKKEKHELSSLVRSIKMKSKQVQLPSNGKVSKKNNKLQSRGKEEKEDKHGLSYLVQSVKRKTKIL